MKDYYLHRKTGGIYRVMAQEYVRADQAEGHKIVPMYGDGEVWAGPYTVTDAFPANTLVVFYENARTGQRWARAFEMFGDGRFARFDKPPLELLASLKTEAG